MKVKLSICIAIMLNCICYTASAQQCPSGNILYVDSSVAVSGNGSSWSNAMESLADAVQLAHICNNIDTILVAKGTYLPEHNIPTTTTNLTDRDKTFCFMRNNLVVLGGYPSGGGSRNFNVNQTTLSGDIGVPNDSTDNVYHVVVVPGPNIDSTLIIDGFHIKGGNANLSGQSRSSVNGTFVYTYGGGAICIMYSNPLIKNCTLSRNYAINGGAVFTISQSNYTDYPKFRYCTFIENGGGLGGGVYNRTYSSPRFNNCSFLGNHSPRGGAICNVDNSSPRINDCVFTGNDATTFAHNDYGGGALYSENGSSPVVNNCVFTSNSGRNGGAIHNRMNTSITVNNSTFSDNYSQWDGGAVYNQASNSSHFNKCEIFENAASRFGGGIYGIGTFRNCIISGNTAQNNGGGIYSSSGNFFGCLVSGNYTGTDGGGLAAMGAAYFVIDNCTFAGNRANNTGGAVYKGGFTGLPTIRNSIIWGNSDGITGNNFHDIAISYSLVQGLTSTANNNFNGFTTDPLFENALAPGFAPTDSGNYRLTACSPLIDMGNNNYVPTNVIHDLDNYNRIWNSPLGTVDLGAYEFQASKWIPVKDTAFEAICSGDSFLFLGNYYSTPVVVRDTVTATNGCDSIVTLSLTINDTSVVHITNTHCDSAVYNNHTYYTSGTYTQLHTNSSGCDSTVIFFLTINNSSSNSLTGAHCDSATYNGHTYYTSGVYTQTYANSSGCDSVLTLNLTINNSFAQTITNEHCDSATYNGHTYYTSGVYTQSYITTENCDSIITYDLTINNSIINNIIAAHCDSAVYGDSVYHNSGIYSQVFMSDLGCDSTVTYDLTIIKIDSSVSIDNNALTANQAGAAYQWYECNPEQIIQGATGRTYTPTKTGRYKVIITQNNCSTSSGCFNIETTRLNDNVSVKNTHVCIFPNPANDYFEIHNVEIGSTITILDILGRKMKILESLNTTLKVSTVDMLPGSYIVKIEKDRFIVNKKILIVK